MCGGGSYIKICVYYITVCFVIFGIIEILFALTLANLCSEPIYNDGCPKSFQKAYPVLIYLTSVAVAVVLNFIVCFGACRDNMAFMRIFIITAALLILVEVVLCIWGLSGVLNESAKTHLKKHVTEIFQKKMFTNVHNIQQATLCCGLNGPEYWGQHLPESCFERKDRSKKQFVNGCLETSGFYLATVVIVLSCMAIISAICQAIAIVAAIFMIKESWEEDDDD